MDEGSNGGLETTKASAEIAHVDEIDKTSPTQDNALETSEKQDSASETPEGVTETAPTLNDGRKDTVESTDVPPKVRYKVEYREIKDNTVLSTREQTGSHNQRKIHEGVVFDVVDVNYTAETKDTQKQTDQTTSNSGTPPSVGYSGNQYVRIYSRAIVNALHAVVNYYPYTPIAGEPVDIPEPYAILAHHQEKLEEFRESFKPEIAAEATNECLVNETYEHLGYLLEFLESRMGDKIRKEKERWAQPVPKASFDMLWLLLRPGIDVCYDVDEEKSREPYVVASLSFSITNQSWTDYIVYLWNLNGHENLIMADERTHTIARFHGEKPIHELDIFPSEYLEGHAEWRQKMVERGKSFFNLRQKKCMYFDGEADLFPRRTYKDYVMLDPGQEFEDLDVDVVSPNEDVDRKPSRVQFCFCKRCSGMETEMIRPAKFNGYKRVDVSKVQELTDHQYFLCSRSTRAFMLGTREWKLLFVTGFSQPKWNTEMINDLVIKEHFKKMLQSLSKMFIGQQSSSQSKASSKESTRSAPIPWTADFVEKKGKGLVFLLHGKPGVGKTYTAECIAQFVERPLLTVTCADIGVSPSEVEANLRGWFKKATRWGAIMLLDEADVYMEFRQIHDLNRNNLVACFLRAIEYYDGVLFLTTNRIGTFDEAFLSRINVSLYYPTFDDKDRQRIWHNYFDKLEKDRGNEISVPESVKEYATGSKEVQELEWNGREIRNAFQIAVNLAQAEGNDKRDEKGRFVVKREHIKVTVELSKDFKEYMHSIHHKSDSERAQIMGYRQDSYNTPSKLSKEYV